MHRNKCFIGTYFIIFLLAAVTGILVSCSEAEPEHEDRDKNKIIEESLPVLEKKSPDEIWRTWDPVLQASYDNVWLGPQIRLEKPEEIGVFTFEQRELTEEEQDRVLTEFVPDRQKKYESRPENVNPPGVEYDNPVTGEHLGVGTNGFVYYMKNDKVSAAEQGELEETIFLDRKYKNKSFRLRDGKISIKKAVKLAEQMENRWEKTVEAECSHRLRKVEVYASEEDEDIKNLVFTFEKCYKGVSILTAKSTVEDGEKGLLSEEDVPYYDDKVIVSSVKEAEAFSSNAGLIKVKTEEKSGEILSLRSAIQLFSDKIEGHFIHEVKSIKLSYRFCNEEGENCQLLEGTEYKAHPCWVFWMDEEPDMEEFALVDCSTGEVKYVRNY